MNIVTFLKMSEKRNIVKDINIKKQVEKLLHQKCIFIFKIYVDICNILNYFIEINFDDKNITNVFELLICC